MDKRVKDVSLEFTIGKTNLEVSIYEHDIGINVLSIHAEHIDKYSDKNNCETLLEDTRTFINTKLASILASNNIDIVGVRSKTTSYNWCSLSFYVDHLDNINAFKVLFKKAQELALDNGLIPFGSEFSIGRFVVGTIKFVIKYAILLGIWTALFIWINHITVQDPTVEAFGRMLIELIYRFRAFIFNLF